MQAITNTDDFTGSFDWELPPDLSKKIERLSPVQQQEIRELFRREISGFLKILIALRDMESNAPVGLAIIQKHIRQMATELLPLIKKK